MTSLDQQYLFPLPLPLPPGIIAGLVCIFVSIAILGPHLAQCFWNKPVTLVCISIIGVKSEYKSENKLE